MSDGIGEVIGSTGRESVIDSDIESTNGNEGGINDPEIISGYEVEQPRTERINSGGDDTGIRYKRDGSIDGRSARRLNRESAATPRKEKSFHIKLSLTDAVYGLHAGIAAVFNNETLKLDKEESKILGDAVEELSKHYNVPIDPKKIALFGLFTAMGTVYGPRILAHRIKKSMEPKPEPTTKPTLVPKPQPAATAPAPHQPAQGARNPAQMTPSELFGTSSDASL